MADYRLFPYTVKDIAPRTTSWNLGMVNAPSFWEKTKGNSVVVAVIDTGLDVNHPEFEGRVYKPHNFTTDGGSYDVTDIEGHGTHVAGIIAGKTCGIAPEARIMPLKVFGNGNGFQFQDAFRWIRLHNASCDPADKVVAVNCSWGGGNDPAMNYVIRELVSDGVAVVVSAGNAGDGNPDTSEIFNYPGFLWEVITIGALGQNGITARYSSSYDGIDLGAPGTDIYSAWPGGGYKVLSGTSMSAPHVTGACALIAAAWKDRDGVLPREGDIEGVLFKHIKRVDADERLVGRGILDLTYNTNRWPLYRVQVGAYYNKTGADFMADRLNDAEFPTYKVKY
jgi:major intracellular serine protease